MKYLLLILAMTLSCAAQAHKIGYIDTNYIMLSSNEGKRATQQLLAKKEQYDKELAAQSAKLEKLSRQLQKSGNAHLQKQYDDMLTSMKYDRASAEHDLLQMRNQISVRLNKMLIDVADSWRMYEGYDVLYSIEMAITVSEYNIVTEQVLETFNKKHP